MIVSEDGYVLTAGHVIGQPGRDARIRLPDGRTFAGKTLGIHTSADGGLVKITEEGEWDYVEIISAKQAPKVGICAWLRAMQAVLMPIGHRHSDLGESFPSTELGFGRIVR